MGKITVALISGGVSSEREVSINSGNQVYDVLDKDRYHVLRYDPKTDLARLVADAPRIDVALIILHGPYGEDGTVQGLLELLNIPYQGSGVLGSALAMNKLYAKYMYEQSGIPVPPYLVLGKNDPIRTDTIIGRLDLPLVIKPVEGGSSVGMSIVRSRETFTDAVAKAFEEDDSVLVEAYIEGVELTGGVIGNAELQALPLIEIIPEQGHEFFDYHAKYTAGATREICPARVDETITQKAQSYAVMAHQALACRGYSRTDMILSGKALYVLETNTIPGMTATSLLPQAAQAAGIPFGNLMDRLIQLALEDRKR